MKTHVDLNLAQWYAISLAAMFGIVLLNPVSRFLQFLYQRARYFWLWSIAVPLIWPRFLGNMTRMQGAILMVYVIWNAVFMAFEVQNNRIILVRGVGNYITRSGIMASVNMIPLFLGGRTSLLADFLGVSLHEYYLMHHCVGRVVVAQGLLHAILVVASGKLRLPLASDIMLATSLVLILISSLRFMRKLAFEVFLKLHLVLAMTTIAALIWHLLPGNFLKVLVPVIALALWTINFVLSPGYIHHLIYNLLRSGRGSLYREATIYKYQLASGGGALKLELRWQSLDVTPGKYVYLYLPEVRCFQSHPFVIAWWNESTPEVNKEGEPPHSGQPGTTLSFLIQPREGLTSMLSRRTSVRTATFDGPYGQNLHLDEYDNVTLIAQGIGIAGVLPYIRHLSKRRFHMDEVYRRGLITRRVNLFWILDDNSQAQLTTDFFLQLQEEDKLRLLLQVWCYYPQSMTENPVIKVDDHWKCLYPELYFTIPAAIRVIVSESAGRNIIVGCGPPILNATLRGLVSKITTTHNVIEFAEVEYHPPSTTSSSPELPSRYLEDPDNVKLPQKRQFQLESLNSFPLENSGKQRASLYDSMAFRFSGRLE